MKKFGVSLVVVAAVIAVGLWVSQLRIQLTLLDGERVKVARGGFPVKVKANGTIEPSRTVEIKSKASGEVIAIHFQPGDVVKADALLLELKKDDEQRKFDIADRDHRRAKANHAKAKITLEDREKTIPIEVRRAQAQLDAAKARHKKAEADLERVQSLDEQDYSHKRELVNFRTLQDTAAADVKIAQAALETAQTNQLMIKLAEEDVKLAHAAEESAKTSVDDAKERLNETMVRSPIDGMVIRTRGHAFVEEGEVIQDGKFSLTGGTVLMEVADISELYVLASVDEADIGQVLGIAPQHARPGGEPLTEAQATAIGQDKPVEIIVEAFPDQVFKGVIERILPEPSRIGAVVTYDVRIRITSDNRDQLRGVLGLQAEVTFITKSVEGALVIPYDAAKRDLNGIEGVYIPVLREDGSGYDEQFRPCKFGLNNGMFVEVVEGVREGEEVYTRRPQKTRKQREAEQND